VKVCGNRFWSKSAARAMLTFFDGDHRARPSYCSPAGSIVETALRCSAEIGKIRSFRKCKTNLRKHMLKTRSYT